MSNKIIWILLILVASGLVGFKLYKEKEEQLLDATKVGLALGESFGKSINQSGCMQGLSFGYSACNTAECELSANGFIHGCMTRAKNDEFCNSVPGIDEPGKVSEWASSACKNNNMLERKCSRYMKKFSYICTELSEGERFLPSESFSREFKQSFSEKFREKSE